MNKKLIAWIVGAGLLIAVFLAIATPAKALKKNIDSSELTSLQQGGAWVVDVRTASEFAAGHIPGAVNVPLDQLGQASTTWNKQQAIVVYCATGARSANAMAYLSGQGFTKLYNLEKGIVAWTGQLTSGGQASVPAGPTTVKTNGKPVFIDFASST